MKQRKIKQQLISIVFSILTLAIVLFAGYLVLSEVSKDPIVQNATILIS